MERTIDILHSRSLEEARPMTTRRSFVLTAAMLPALVMRSPAEGTNVRAADIGGDIRLHYVEEGEGPPLVFVHGSLSDFSYWQPQFPVLSRQCRTIAYSRRYDWPNSNPAIPGYSALTDADDLAAFIAALNLKRPVVCGHSYGALTALFLAVRHPHAARALVLAEPPAVSLLNHLSQPDSAKGREMFADIEARMVDPMRQAFAAGRREEGVGIFIDYVFRDPHAWERFSAADRADTMKNAHEWDVMMTAGTLFPDLPPAAVRNIDLPVLMFSGAESYPFLMATDAELERLLRHVKRFVIPGTGHQMWVKDGEFCRAWTLEFLHALS
jgi:pimeloyl-ACP methyl ester carboxylesterase